MQDLDNPMTIDPEDMSGDDGFKLARHELEGLRDESTLFVKQRLLMWAIRWIIGFAIISAVVAYQPQWSWLWWVGGGAALVSLVLVLAGDWLIQKRIDKSERRARELVAEVAELEERKASQTRGPQS